MTTARPSPTPRLARSPTPRRRAPAAPDAVADRHVYVRGVATEPQIPTEEFRDSYLLHAPASYATNYVSVIAPVGATVTLDDMPVGALAPIGAPASRPRSCRSRPRTWATTASPPTSRSVDGHGEYTSYWYPGGSDAHEVVQ
jgi:hypothetical protein